MNVPPILLALGVVLLALALWLRWRIGLPWARVVAEDVSQGRPTQRALYARRYGLTGRPDYLIERHGSLIPVEVKPSRQARTPYHSDLMQLAAYCLLVEESSGRAPPYGLLRYADKTFRLRYTAAVRAELLAIVDEMRDQLEAEDVERSHTEPARCAGCGLRTICEDSLA